MPTLEPLRRIYREEDEYRTLGTTLTLHETGTEVNVHISCLGSREEPTYSGSIIDRDYLHETKGSLEHVLRSLEEYLTEEELIPNDPEFLNDRELLTLIVRETGAVRRVLETVQVRQEYLEGLHRAFSDRQPLLGIDPPRAALQRVAENPLDES